MRRRLALLVIAVSCSACSESGTSCTEAGCIDGLEVYFPSALQAPELSVVLQFDGREIQCELQGQDQGLNTCLDEGVWIKPNGDVVTEFRLPGQHPEQLTFSISAEGTVLLSATVTPTYEIRQPNGPDCPPTCKNGNVQL